MKRADESLSAASVPTKQRGQADNTPLVVDTTQVTSKGNYSNPKPGDLEFWIASALE